LDYNTLAFKVQYSKTVLKSLFMGKMMVILYSELMICKRELQSYILNYVKLRIRILPVQRMPCCREDLIHCSYYLCCLCCKQSWSFLNLGIPVLLVQFIFELSPCMAVTQFLTDGVKTTPCSQNSLNALAIDEPLEYARLALDGEMQAWVDAVDSLNVW